MGLGGYLTWSAAFAEIHKKFGKRILPIEVHGNQVRIVDSTIFKNNPIIVDSTIDNLENYQTDYHLVPLNLPATNYCKNDTPTHAKHRYDTHIISQILDYYKVEHTLADTRCRLYFTDQEQKEVDDLASVVGTDVFITIEPHSNNEYTCNRQYPFEKWQNIVDNLCEVVRVVQVGRSNVRVLDNVIDVTAKTTFRTCAGLIGRSKLFLSTEGGLTHAAQAVGTKSIVVITGYQHPDMVAYPQNINMWIHKNHGPCGKKQKCEECWDAVIGHDEQEIINEAMGVLHNDCVHERLF